MKKLKLFVWENVLCDWQCGHVAVLAFDVEQARSVVRETTEAYQYQSLIEVFTKEPVIHEDPVAILCYGSA